MSTEPLTLDQFWRCPVCGIATATGSGVTFTKPPRCSHGEMEQITAEGFIAAKEDDDD